MLDAANKSFVGYMAGEPVRHGMTMGELAKMFNAENKIGANLTVIPMQDWQRGDWFDSTNLAWVNPSPNMRSLNAAMLYPGLCLLEYSEEFLGGPRHRCAVRTDRRRFHRRPRTGRLSESAPDSRSTRVPHQLHADGIDFQRRQDRRRALS